MTPENNSNQNVIKIHYSSLPLCCMGDKVSSHPKVNLPIEKSLDKTIQCPYCSTIYVLVNDEN